MSEYWKSTPKYWCKHCSTYVKDTPFERKQHESTAKHQINLKRFLRDIQNSHERGERDKERAKSEVERLKAVAGGDSKPSASTSASASPRTATTGPLSGADQKRQWTQLAAMGIKVPEQHLGEVAMDGDWRVVSQRTVDDANDATPEEPLSKGIRKRKHEGEEHEDDFEPDATAVRHAWGSSTKRYPGHDTPDLDDLLAGPIALKREKTEPSGVGPKREADADESVTHDRRSSASHGQGEGQVDALPKGESPDDNNDPTVKDEKTSTPHISKPMDQIPEEVSMPVFKKRKAKVS